MLNALMGRKLGMTRIFTEDGRWIPVTVVQTGPCQVVQRKTADTDGYEAVQLGIEEKKESRCNKPELGHFKKHGVTPKRVVREFRVGSDTELKTGDEVRADLFKAGDRVDISGTSKGKGFQGVIKRHGMHGGPAAHGSMFHRAPGSIGQSADPSKVYKGKRLPGHMGDVKRTIQNVEVVRVDLEKNLVLVRGAVPGANGGVVVLKHSVKGRK